MTALNKQALREKFEAWAEEAGALPWGHLKKQRTASGNYSVQIYTYMWHAWNACHEVFLDELEAAEKHIAELESLPVTPVMYSENSDADHCRQQAWKQVKDEVSTDGWSTSDSVNYFGFFCWGWDARRQYNEKRPTTVTLPEVRITVAESKRKNLTWRELGAYNEGADVAKEAILAVIRAAGIGVKGD
ncbi:TPA: hypothetical protein LG948_003984 [Citrobacter freundii]|nr:hypothetical protein [Citrobacter freundii]HBK3072673.1 hypothetical protein [Citrobacter freundii]